MSEVRRKGETIPVGVLVERGTLTRGKWSFPKHTVLGVVSGDNVRADACEATLVREEGELRQQLWRGLDLTLFPDSAESYWYNLTAERPSLFVICRDDGGFRPVHVTANHDEAAAHMEADDEVFATAIPPEIYQRLERFVVEHFKPEAPKKRRRRKWSDDEQAV